MLYACVCCMRYVMQAMNEQSARKTHVGEVGEGVLVAVLLFAVQRAQPRQHLGVGGHHAVEDVEVLQRLRVVAQTVEPDTHICANENSNININSTSHSTD